MRRRTQSDVSCCPITEHPEPDLRPVEGPEADEELAALAKAAGHAARVRILRLLARKETRVCSQIVDELPLAQSTVSEHLRILKEAGLITSSGDGARTGYCIQSSALRRLKALIAAL
ncbi:MAG TPA: metalloregulator ArsR/SmtB family transcription factor [Bryobacteraceae bacterium]|nr:metalloregulator ArsR/SmtB family transcription factor [Bryobacteraceae bacterium]